MKNQITIGGHVLEFRDNQVWINGTPYPFSVIKEMHELSHLPHVNIVLFGQTCSKELLWEIINRLNE